MSIDHLSDEQIQQYLDSGPSAFGDSAEKHLEGCHRCQATLKEYQVLYNRLGRETETLLSPNFTSDTMAKIEALAVPAARLGRPMFYYVVLGVVSCLLAIWYTIDLKAALNAVGSFLLGQNVIESTVGSSLKTVSSQFGDNIGIIIFAALILIGVALTDKLLFRQKLRKVYFLSV